VSRPAKARKLTLAECIDELGDVRGELKRLDQRESELRAEILKHRKGEGVGERFAFVISSAARWNLDLARIKQELGEDWVSARSRLSTITTIRVTPRLMPRAVTDAGAA